MSLTDATIRGATGAAKPFKLYDADGLYLLVSPAGSKLWRFKYRLDGVEKLISLGAYPEVSLEKARKLRVKARESVAAGDCPSRERQEEKAKLANTFEAVAEEHLEQRAKVLGEATLRKTRWFLETFLLPDLRARPIDSIDAPEMLRVLKKVEARGLTDSVSRVKTLAGRIFRFGIATGRCSRDPTQDLKGAITVEPPEHHAALTDPKDVGALLRAIDVYRGRPPTAYALRLLPLLFLRSSELRGATWAEIDLEGATWRVPAGRMKMDEAHIVPLARQAVDLFRELHKQTGGSVLVFPSLRPGKPLSDSTLNVALLQLGYERTQQTPHGFRTIASTLLNELGVAPDLIELQLAHKERNSVRAAYNRAQRLEERRAMMQLWADHLDSLKAARE